MRHVRLRRGVFRAEVIPDRFRPSALYHYVVQREGSSEVLAWGQERSHDAAAQAAERHIQRLYEDRAA